MVRRRPAIPEDAWEKLRDDYRAWDPTQGEPNPMRAFGEAWEVSTATIMRTFYAYGWMKSKKPPAAVESRPVTVPESFDELIGVPPAEVVERLMDTVLRQQRRIEQLEAFIGIRGLELPPEIDGALDEQLDLPPLPPEEYEG